MIDFKEPILIKDWKDFDRLAAGAKNSFVASYSINTSRKYNRLSHVTIIDADIRRCYNWSIEINSVSVYYQLDRGNTKKEIFFSVLQEKWPRYFEWLLWHPEWTNSIEIE